MIPVLTADQMRALEQRTEAAGTAMAALMERAGEAIAQAALGLAAPKSRFWVVCGPGNNGGDGLVAARALRRFGRPVQVTVAADLQRLSLLAGQQWARLRGEVALTALDAFEAKRGDVVIDALFGTGLNRAPAGALREAILAILRAREAGAKVVSADLPSGLPSDDAHPFDPCVRADLTLALGAPKRGQVLEPGAGLCGRLVVVEIGLGRAPPSKLVLLEEGDVRGLLPRRSQDSHKGTFGHVLVIAGGPGKSGAAAMSALGALRGGAGLVTVASRSDALPWIQLHAPELMGIPLANMGPLGMGDLEALLQAGEKKSAIVVGPGIPRGPETGALIGALLARLDAPFVLDADALNALAGSLEALNGARGEVILTPHPGEMARLCGVSTAEIQRDRIGKARTLAAERRVTVVLKGARTLIARAGGQVAVNPTGNPGMATGGSGDVLSGLLGALLAQGLKAEAATHLGVFAHGLAGDLASARSGEAGLIATDLLDGLCQVWRRWDR